MLARILAGVAVALAIALAARRAGSLARSGAVAAVAVGSTCVAAGWGWGALLIAFFVASSALSRWGRAAKAARTAAVVEKGDERDAWQVLANGGVFAAAALGTLVVPSPAWLALGAGALAASTADTWATEIGTQFGGAPRSILTGRRLAAGMSGGVTVVGTLGSLAGAAFLAALAAVVGWGRAGAWAALVGGVAGSIADSLLGALVQERRRCARCDAATERLVHDCGTRTDVTGGIAGVGNDAVNLAASLVGAAAGVAVGAAMHSGVRGSAGSAAAALARIGTQ